MSEHVASFRVHAAEVNAFGELPTVSLLRLFQQAASDASAAAGYDVDWYRRHGSVWLIRRSTVELPDAIRYPQILRIRTWVSDMRRVRSQREYEVRREDGELVARGHTDWVYVDTARGRPATPPEELQKALMPHGLVKLERPRRAAGEAPRDAHRGRRRVELAHLDSIAHVNNAYYSVYCEQALFDALAAAGWPVLPGAPDGHLRPTMVDVEYFEGALYDDVVEVATWAGEQDDCSFSSHHLLTIRDRRCLLATWRWQWTDGALPPEVEAAVRRISPV